MNFKQATDALLKSVTLEDLAAEMGVSVQAVRQARAQQGSSGFRRPPLGWEMAAAKLARQRAMTLGKLADRLGG